jgi:P-loop containing NTP hydrolase pore-1
MHTTLLAVGFAQAGVIKLLTTCLVLCRDLDDVGAPDIAVQPLNKLPYGSLNGKVAEGVIFLTYSSLISSSEKVLFL